MAVSSSFVVQDGVHLHVRRCGERGVPLVMLHQAPTSARVLESRIERFGADFQCIAPDIPGLGRSDALDTDPVTIEKLAGLFNGMLEKLAGGPALLYGSHTGALVVTEMAIQRPDLAAAVVTNGYPIYTAEESAQRLATYFPALEPNWDGSHLVWLWYRYREQFLYWPWNTKDPGTRAHCALPSPEYLHKGVAEIAARHDTYARVYAAAFGYDAPAALTRISVPMHLVVEHEDSLSLKIGHVTEANASLALHPCTEADVEAVEHEVLIEAAVGIPARGPISISTAAETRYFSGEGWRIIARRLRGAGGRRAVVVLPPFPAGSVAIEPELPRALDRDVILLDLDELPGNGDAQAALQALGEVLAGVLDVYGVASADLVVHDEARALALPLARASARIARVLVVEAASAPPSKAFDPRLCASGGHLLRLWDRLRFKGLGASERPRHESLERLGRLAWSAIGAAEQIPAWDRLIGNFAAAADGELLGERIMLLKAGVHAREALAGSSVPDLGFEPGPPNRPLAAALRMLSQEQGS